MSGIGQPGVFVRLHACSCSVWPEDATYDTFTVCRLDTRCLKVVQVGFAALGGTWPAGSLLLGVRGTKVDKFLFVPSLVTQLSPKSACLDWSCL